MASQEPATGPAVLGKRQGREAGAETDWEAVTESEMNGTVTLAEKASVSVLSYTKAVSHVEK